MAGHAFPHIIFATDADTLPRADLRALLEELFGDGEPAPVTEEGALEVRLRLGEYAFTFWYDDEAEGLGERYETFAPPLWQRRLRRCTTMIDASGGADPGGAHAADADRITRALAARDGVYVFSEEAKSFVGMDQEAPAQPVAPVGPLAPQPAAQEPLAPVPGLVVPDVAEPAAQAEPVPDVTEPAPAWGEPAPGATEVAEVPEDAPTPEVSEPAPAPAPQPEPARAEASEPEPAEPAEKPGFLKRLFGRGRG